MKRICVLLVAVFFALTTIQPAAAQAVSEGEPGFRLFDHELLATDPVYIPESSQRIVALDLTAVELHLFTDKEFASTFDWIVLDLGVTMPDLQNELADVTHDENGEEC